MKKIIPILLIILLALSCSQDQQRKKNLDVFVSILPQKYFVEQIARNKVAVHVMILPGHSPIMFEPTPSQMKELSTADIYFRIGLPFETAWLSKLSSINPELVIVDTRRNVPLRNMDSFDAHQIDHTSDVQKDPHIWLSPKMVKILARNICDALQEYDPDNSDFYEENVRQFIVRLTELQKEITAQLDSLQSKSFLVFHPSWGYFADEFGLKQVPIEIEGKSPSPRQMNAILTIAKKNNIRVIFVQKQFSATAARAIADEIRGRVVYIDPLAEDYFTNLREITKVFKRVLDNE